MMYNYSSDSQIKAGTSNQVSWVYAQRNQLLVLILLFCWKQGLTQAPALTFQRLSLQQGLKANYTSAMAQDTPGFIWIATVKGVTRFDGLRCLNFSYEAGNPRSLSHRITRTIFTSRNGTLWVGAQEGLSRFEPATQSFRRYSFTHLGAGCNFIRFITESQDGRLWLGTKGGIIHLNPATGQGTLLALPYGAAPDARSIRRILVDGHTLWIGTQVGLYAYDLPTKRVRYFQHDDAVASSLPDNYITSIARNPRTGEILVGTNQGYLTSLNPATGVFRPLERLGIDQPVSAILFTRTGDLWVGVMGNGLHHYNAVANRFFHYVNNENNIRSLISNSISALYEDRSGVIWALTNDAGVCWFNPIVDKFHSLFDEIGYQPDNTLGFDASALSIDQTTKSLWVATRDGVTQINLKDKSYRLYHHDPKNANSLLTNHVYSVLADQRGRIWVGTILGLDRLQAATGQVEHIISLTPPLKSTNGASTVLGRGIAGNQVFVIVEAADGKLFIGTNEKLTIYDPKTGLFSHQFNDPRIEKLPGKNYNTLFFDRHQNLWVGGLGPVYKISPDLRLLATYTHTDDPQSVPDEGVTAFAEDRFGRMWLGTDNGLACLNQKTGKSQVFTTLQGLPNDDIAGLIMLGDTLWLSTSGGLASMDVRRFRVKSFTESNGSAPSEFESGSVIRDSTGRIYFGGMQSLVYTQPNAIRQNQFVPPVYLTSFRANGKELIQDPSSVPSRLELQPNQNMFSFEMVALSFDNPVDNRYAYKLENFDEDWKQDGNRSFASYTNVPPGDYVLRVIAANNDGVWNKTGYRLPITILAPFWRTAWFRVIALITLLTLTGLVVRWREQQRTQEQREKSELRERIAASEMKALRSQMNPHFLYNSLNAIRLFILQNDSDNADKYLVKFARLMRLILDNSRQEWVSLASELEQLTLYLELEQLRFDHQFDFSVTADPSLPIEKVAIPPMIIQPYIENAILHGIAHKKTKGCIQLRIEPQSDHLDCTVDDNGVGRERAQSLKKQSTSHKSVGLRVTEDRLQLIGQRSGQAAGVTIIDKYDEQQQATGTKVVVQLPFIRV